MKIENPDEIYTWNIEQLWNAINTIPEENLKEYENKIYKIKHGYNIKVPIQWIIKKWYEEHPYAKRVSIWGYAKYELLPFIEEIEKREQEMRKIIEENIEDDEITQGRELT